MSEMWTHSGFLQVAGKSLEYQCYGANPKDKPTLVLLHEGLGSAALWRNFPTALAERTGWGVLAYSRVGYGQSDLAELPRPLDYMTREAHDYVSGVLNSVGVQRAVLLGHSDGATIASIYAGTVDDSRVGGLILMAPHFFTEDVALVEIAKARDAFENGMLKDRMSKYHRDSDNAFRGWNDSWLHPDFESWNVAHVLNGISVPVLAIQGREDQYGTLRQLEEIETRCKTDVTLTILDNCRHSPFLDQAQKVVDAVHRYCADLSFG